MTRTGLSRSPGSSDGVPSFDTTTQKLFTTPMVLHHTIPAAQTMMIDSLKFLPLESYY